MSIKLHDYQKKVKDFILKTPYCGIFLEMGLGKTLITLEALYELNPRGHVLVIAPKPIARSTWLDEIEKWGYPFRIKSLIFNEKDKQYTKKERLKKYKEVFLDPPTIYFINQELIVDLIKHMPKTKDPRTRKEIPYWPFPYLVIDEFQSFKSYKSKRFKALKTIRPQVKRLIGLTGTPTPNGLMDLWSTIYLLDQGKRLGPNITAYRNTFFFPTKFMNNIPVQWTPIHNGEETIHKRINDITISADNSHLTLPQCTINDIYVHMSEKEEKLYKKMLKTKVLEIDKDVITAANAGVLTMKLSQMASGAIYTEEGNNKEFKVIHEKKLEHCDYLIRNTTTPVIIAYHFKSDLKMLKDYLEKKKHKVKVFDGSKKMIDQWNQKEIPVLLFQPASFRHGINIQDGGHTLIWYTMPWSLESYQQTNARIYRQGQKENVVIHRILTKNTIDNQIRRALENKDTSQKALLDAVEKTLYC